MSNLVNCEIYRSTKKNETYLYLQTPVDFDLVPEALMKSLGTLEFVMKLGLSPEKKLARENVLKVIENIQQKGFYLQMPPDAKSLLAIHNPNVSGSTWDR